MRLLIDAQGKSKPRKPLQDKGYVYHLKKSLSCAPAEVQAYHTSRAYPSKEAFEAVRKHYKTVSVFDSSLQPTGKVYPKMGKREITRAAKRKAAR